MTHIKRLRTLLVATLAGAVATLVALPVQASDITGSIPPQLGPSGLPLPRFVSLKGNKVNLRVGPGLGYAVEWRYLKSGVPMEIIQEYDNWRRVRDADGAEGWINQSLLSGRRTAIAAPWHRGKDMELQLAASPTEGARAVARLEPGVIGTLRTCNGEWCELDIGGRRGWISQSLIWGAYPGEAYKD